MKHLLTSFLAGFILIACNSQQSSTYRGEFATNPNGLMYSDADMKHLRFIVDSLNLKYKTCDFFKTYYSMPQAKVYYVSFKSTTNDLKQIVEDLKNKTGFLSLVNKYKSFISTLDTSQIIIRGRNSNQEKEKYYFLEGKPKGGYETFYMEAPFNKKDEFAGEWYYEYSEIDKKDKDDYYYLVCRFFPESFQQKKIPDTYGRLIQYVDCMIDTSAVVFLTDKYTGGFFRPDDDKDSYSNMKELLTYINSKVNDDKLKGSVKTLSEEQISFAINNLSGDEHYKQILGNTINNFMANKSFNSQLETLAEKAGMFDKALQMKRSYRVMGGCSQDESPRIHARDIAILAGKAHSWDIFLRAHLDIMNDRFERASDGSYAWAGRKTYLKELEELNLNIVDMMLGLTLRASNVSTNHYYGTVWRLGWALTESKEKDLFEQKAISIMKDESIDEFNRGLLFLLYESYINHLDEKEATVKIEAFKKIKNSFPVSIKNSIEEIELPKQKRRDR